MTIFYTFGWLTLKVQFSPFNSYEFEFHTCSGSALESKSRFETDDNNYVKYNLFASTHFINGSTNTFEEPA